MQHRRAIHYDILRIIAAFSVVMLHTSAQFWYVLPVTDVNWIVANSYDALVRFGVPVFVMISGALFLNPEKEIPLKKLYTHNVLRMLILYVVWSCLYGLWDLKLWTHPTLTLDNIGLELTTGRYQLWFLRMIAGIYMLVPILRTWLAHAKKRDVEYFLLLFFLVQVIRQTLGSIFHNIYTGFVLGLFDVEMVCSYLGYFVLGYYLVYLVKSEEIPKWIYPAGVAGLLGNGIISFLLSKRAGQPMGEFFDSYGIGTFLCSVALFCFGVQVLSQKKYGTVSTKIITEISADTLGIYMLHIGLLEYLESIGIHNSVIPPIVGIPVLSLCSFLICGVAAALLRRIPVIGKYLC